MNKACFALIVLMSPASLFAGVTMVAPTTSPSTKCDFRVDKCETAVATDPSYLHFKDGASIPGPSDIGSALGDSTAYRSSFGFANYTSVQHLTLDELLALIRTKLSNCPEVTVSYDNDSGDLTVHYLNTTCDCDCDWTVNVRHVKTADFVTKRSTDNYSPRLGQMERRKVSRCQRRRRRRHRIRLRPDLRPQQLDERSALGRYPSIGSAKVAGAGPCAGPVRETDGWACESKRARLS